jgi:MFS family permease
MLGTLLSEIFSVEVRYTGISLGYQIGAALAGGTSPLIGTWLLARSHGQWYGIALFIALTATISGLAVALGARPKPETHAS